MPATDRKAARAVVDAYVQRAPAILTLPAPPPSGEDTQMTEVSMFLTAQGEQDQQAQPQQKQAQAQQEQEPAQQEQEQAQQEDDENMGPPNAHEPDLGNFGGEAGSTASQLSDRLDADEVESTTPTRRKSGRLGQGTQKDWVSP